MSNPTIPVFAYGSNLDEAQMARRCPSAVATFPAVLDGHRIAFQGYSSGWGGGVATIVPDALSDVSGMIYLVTPQDLRRLDRYEGHPVVYARGSMQVTRVDGERQSVQVYRRRPGAPCRPSQDYLETILCAYSQLGFDSSTIEDAADEPPRGKHETKLVFVYGSLLRGLSNHQVLIGNGYAEFVRTDRTMPEHTMLDLGGYPGVIHGGDTSILGEVWRVDAECLEALDRLEGHPTFYRREPVQLAETSGAVTYFLQDSGVIRRRSNYNRPIVLDGDWRRVAAWRPRW